MTTVVLGWDGLDPALMDEYGVDFPGEARSIGTIVNPELGKPHTWELWPSIITGQHPDDHGVRAETFISGAGFESATLNVAARLSEPIVPDGLRWRVGRLLRDRGAGFDFKRLEYYRDRDIPTVFDAVDGLAIAIPNARSQFDDALGLETDRGAYLSEYLDRSGETVAAADIQLLRSRAEADAAKKLGLVSANIGAGYDLIFAWIAYVDTLGHVAPTVDDPKALMRDVYAFVERQTRQIASLLSPADTLLCLSDHGLQGGEHTETACLTGPTDAIESVESVLDVADVIDAATRQDASSAAYQATGQSEAVETRLQDLGYL